MTTEERDTSKKATKVTVFSDYIWPYCYIGLYRVERLKQDYNVLVEWKAFELHPETPPEGKPRPLRAVGSNEPAPSIRILSQEVGLRLKRPDVLSCSRPALEATEYAKEKLKFDEFHLAVFTAYWEEGKNIGLTSVLLEIANKSGLDGDELEYRLYEGWYTRQVDREKQEASSLGVTGIPAYIIGNYLVEGARPYETFRLAMELSQ